MTAFATARQIDPTALATGPLPTPMAERGDTANAPAPPARLIGAWWRGWIAWASSMQEGGLR